MQINFDTIITNLKGEDMKTILDNKEEVLSLKDVTVNALLAEIKINQNEPALTGKQKLRNYMLSQKIYEGGKVDVTAEEIALIKEQIGKVYSTLIVGSSYKILESTEEVKDK